MQTTVGQLLVNEALPPEYRDYERVMTKDEADEVLGELARKDPEKFKDVSFKMMELGRHASFEEGTTLRLSDLKPVMDKAEMLKHVKAQEREIARNKDLTPEEREQTLEAMYSEVQKYLTDATYKAALAAGNPFALQVKSKARGAPSQLAAILSTPSVYQDGQGRTIPVFIQNSYSEGLEPHEYWAATYGARKALLSTKFATRDAGYLGKQMGNAMADVVVTTPDCETPYGIPVGTDDADSVGSVLAEGIAGFPAGTVVTKAVLSQIHGKKKDEIMVRSPITCGVSEGVCQQCSGIRDSGRFPELGHHLGYNASSALAERIAQSSLNVKHTSGQTDGGDRTYGGFDVVEQIAQIPGTFPHRAAVAELDGKVEDIVDAPQGGKYIYIGGEKHYASPEMSIKVEKGDEVEAGDQLSAGIINPADVVRHKGIGEGRRYFMDRMTQAFRDSKYSVNRRNIEVLSRAMINHVRVKDPDGLGDFLPEDVTRYNALAYGYRPRKDASNLATNKAVGQYLEQPVMHYTIGTRVTKKVADRLKKHGIKEVMTHREQPAFNAEMFSLVKTPSFNPDWMARLSSNYLQKRLLEDAQRGAESDTRGLHPAPVIAKGQYIGNTRLDSDLRNRGLRPKGAV